MDFRDLPFTLRQVQYAVAVHQAGGFGSAAAACGVSQPSLSAQVAKLEGLLGAALFERHARQVLLTDAGARLMPALVGLLEDAAHLRDAAASVRDAFDVTLRVALIPTVAPYLLAPLVGRLGRWERSPRWNWLELETAVAEAALAAGEVDAVVIADPASGSGMRTGELGFEPFVVAVAEDSPLTGSIALDDLEPASVLLLDEGHCLRDQTLDLCLRPGAVTSPYRATSLSTLIQMVASGLGVTVLPASAAGVELARARVRVLPFAGRAPGRRLRLVWRQRSPHGQHFEALCEELRALL